MSSLRDTCLAADDIQKELVTVPEWSGAVLQVRGLSSKERSEVLAGAKKVGGQEGEVDTGLLYPALLIATCFDPTSGEKVFSPTDRDALNGKSVMAVERIAKVALKLSGMSTAEVEAIKGNSDATDSDASPSA